MGAADPTPAERADHADSVVLRLLVSEDSHRPWAIEEVEREIGRDPTDSLGRLYGAGLIHRLDHFVWASRAAVVALKGLNV